jgi:hypothetical protein
MRAKTPTADTRDLDFMEDARSKSDTAPGAAETFGLVEGSHPGGWSSSPPPPKSVTRGTAAGRFCG